MQAVQAGNTGTGNTGNHRVTHHHCRHVCRQLRLRLRQARRLRQLLRLRLRLRQALRGGARHRLRRLHGSPARVQVGLGVRAATGEGDRHDDDEGAGSGLHHGLNTST